LNDRSFRVRVGSETSCSYVVNNGVPQGTSIAPLLFALYVEDIRHYLPSELKYLLYADDIKIYSEVRTREDCMILQRGLEAIDMWCVDNGMSIVPSKCALLRVGSGSIQYDYRVGGGLIGETEVVRDLGILISSDLKYIAHIDHVLKTTASLIYMIFRCFSISRPDVYLHLYRSLVIPKLMYCSAVWRPHQKFLLDRFTGIENKFLERLSLRCGAIVPVPQMCKAITLFDK